MEVYQLNTQGYLIGPVEADPNPLEPEKWLIPAGCVTETPPTIPAGKAAFYLEGEWQIVDPPDAVVTLDDAKARARGMVDDWLAQQMATVEFNGQTYQTDALAQQRLQAELQQLQLGNRDDPSLWRTLDNSMVSLSNAQFQDLCKAIYTAHKSLIYQAFNHKDAIEGFATVEAVQGYSIN
jgi:hypothetical protein